MSQKAIREFDGKRMLASWFDKNSSIKLPAQFHQITAENSSPEVPAQWLRDTKLVAKPDQLIKRRGKAGLVKLNATWPEAHAWVMERMNKEIQVEHARGVLDTFIVEPFTPHDASDELYVSIISVREGDLIYFYHQGGVDVGDVDSKAEKYLVLIDDLPTPEDIKKNLLKHMNPSKQELVARFISDLFKFYANLHYAYLEINPLVVKDGQIYPLDLAAKVDQTAEFECGAAWGKLDYPAPFGRGQTPEEKFIASLDAKTGASLKLTILNPNGRIWTMVAGGGASVVYADTIVDSGYGNELANYGEYSGDPSEALTYEYAKTILDLMTRKKDPKGKVLIIGGGIANFTNVAETFKGIIRAIAQFRDKLREIPVRIFVRRGGPNYQQGLKMMRDCGTENNLHIDVYGPETHLTSIIPYALGLKSAPTSSPASKTPAISSIVESPALNRREESKESEEKSPFEPKIEEKKEEKIGLFDLNTVSFVYGMHPKAVQNMLDFDHVCGRKKPSVVAMIYPFSGNHFQKFYWGSTEILIPVYQKMSEAAKKHPQVDVMINFASFRSVYSSVSEALELPQIKVIAVIAEGVPERRTRSLIRRAQERGVTIIGPATVGGIKAGVFRIGNTGGMIDNIIAAKLYRPGSVGYVSRSGGMSNELNNIISVNSNGVYQGTAIGGDRFPGTTFIDHLLMYEKDPAVKMMVLLGEVGGVDEYLVADAIANGTIKKPLVAWCMGTCAKIFPYDVQFGHAGALARGALETSEAKNAALKKVGAFVPNSFEEFGGLIKQVYTSLVEKGIVVEKPEPEYNPVPMDYSWAQRLGLIRKPTSFMSTISDERGDELMYAGMPISSVIQEDLGVGGVISLLWFKRRLPKFATKYIEMILMVTADHGPAVSGAHNTIITARAGKDLISSLVSGLMTIGPRFGGAIDGAAQSFSEAYDKNISPKDFVDEMKTKGELIPGIGHRVKSLENNDKRVILLKEYIFKNFPATEVLRYALEVEQVTTQKKANLILNVDGLIGASFVDLLRGCGAFSREEADSYVNIGCLNALFVMGRSIGLVGHYLDQVRLKQPLYRHPWDDISYLDDQGTFI